MATSSSWTINMTARSNALCSCGASICIRTSWTEANPGRHFLCCSDKCGLLRWLEPPVSCPRCERVVRALLRSSKHKDELVRLKALEAAENGVEARRLRYVLGFSWFLFVLYVLMSWCIVFLMLTWLCKVLFNVMQPLLHVL
ncbi:hypothetical protein Hdeb2414_s0323g00867921 [Helianthus debilis subsp. tardiflorus]